MERRTNLILDVKRKRNVLACKKENIVIEISFKICKFEPQSSNPKIAAPRMVEDNWENVNS